MEGLNLYMLDAIEVTATMSNDRHFTCTISTPILQDVCCLWITISAAHSRLTANSSRLAADILQMCSRYVADILLMMGS